MRRTLASTITIAALIWTIGLISADRASATGAVSAYTLVTPRTVSDTRLQVRAVIPAGTGCPRLILTIGKGRKVTRKMTRRTPGATTGAAFASLSSCQANVPKIRRKIRAARAGGISVPHRLPSTFRKIVMLGDTGCRVDDDDVQNCSTTTGIDPTGYWPLARNAVAVAREKPDLTLFTGDFYYREAACPEGEEFQAKCGGSPAPIEGFEFADTDYGWLADVFIPMAPVFRAAPMLAVRGNHEQCERGGNGWFLFFEVTEDLGPDACAPEVTGGPTAPNITSSWSFDAPIRKGRTLRIVAVDSAYGRNFDVTPWTATQRLAYRKAASLSRRTRGRESWLLTHRPMFGIEALEETVPGLLRWSSVDQTAAAYGLTSNYQLMVASHIHVAQVVEIPGQPPQMVVGNGGSMPDAASPTSYPRPAFGPLATADGTPLDPSYAPYPNADYDWTAVKYGYVVATPNARAKQWTMTQKDFTGKRFSTCALSGRVIACD